MDFLNNIQITSFDRKQKERLFSEDPIGKLKAEQLLRLKINQLYNGAESQLVSVIGAHAVGKTFIIDYVLKDKVFFRIEKSENPLSLWIQLIKEIVYFIQQSDLENIDYWRKTLQNKLQKSDQQLLIEIVPEMKNLLTDIEKPLTIIPTKQYVLLKFLSIITSEMPLILVISSIDSASEKYLMEIFEEGLLRNLLVICDGFFIDCKNNDSIVIQPFSLEDVKLFLEPHLEKMSQSQSQPLIVQNIYDLTLGNATKIKSLFKYYRDNGDLRYDEGKGWIWNLSTFLNVTSYLSDMVDISGGNKENQQLIVKASLLQQPFQFEHLQAFTPNASKLVQFLTDSELFSFNRKNNELRVINSEILIQLQKKLPLNKIQQLHYEICESFINADITLDRIGFHLVQSKDIYFSNEKVDEWLYRMLKAINYIEQLQDYETALAYMELVMESVPQDWWENKRECKRETLEKYADLLLYNDHLKTSSEILNELLVECDDVQIYLKLLRVYELLGDYTKALAISEKIFELLQYKGFAKLSYPKIFLEFKKFDHFLKEMKTDKLSNCTDEKIKIILHISFKLANMCFKIQHKHWIYWCCLNLKESIAHGVTEDSAYGFAAYAVILNAHTKKHEIVFCWGRYAISLVPQSTVKHIQIRLLILLAAETWRKYDKDMFLTPIKVSSKIINKGDDWWEKFYIFFNCGLMFKYSYEIRKIYNYLMLASKDWDVEHFGQFSKQMLGLQYLLRTLLGKPLSPEMQKELIFTQGDLVHSNADVRHVAEQWYSNKYILSFIFEEFEEAYEAILVVFTGQSIKSKESLFLSTHYHYYVLIAYEIYKDKNPTQQSELLKMIRKSMKYYKKVVKSNPEHSEHVYYLTKAVYFDLTSNEKRATEYFEEARLAAKKYSLIHDVAIISELQARRYIRQGDLQFAANYISIALEYYSLWGAIKKVEELEAKSQEILSLRSVNQFKSMDYLPIERLTQTISEATEPKELFNQTIKTIFDIMQVEYAAIFLKKEEEWFLEAQDALMDNSSITDEENIENNYLPLSIIQHLDDSQDVVIIRDIGQSAYGMDQSLMQRNVTSLLCYPIKYKDILLGAIYLENPQSANFYIEDKMLSIRLLSNQLAISINNLKTVKEFKYEETKYIGFKAFQKEMEIQLEAYKENERLLNEQLERTLHIFNLILSQIDLSKQLASYDPTYMQAKLNNLQQVVKHLSTEIKLNLEKTQNNEEKKPLKAMQKLIDELTI